MRITHLSLRCLGLIAVALALAGHAQAGPKMYRGTFYIEGYMNTIVRTVTPGGMAEMATSFTMSTPYVFPFTEYCGGYYLTGKKALTQFVSMGMRYPGTMYVSTVYPRVQSAYNQPCSMGELNVGDPVIGTGTLNTTRKFGTPTSYPPAIILPGGQLYGYTIGSWPYDYPYVYSLEFAGFGTGPGTLYAGGGGGATLLYATARPGFSGFLTVSPGDRQFGGTARILGKAMNSFAFIYTAGVGYFWGGSWQWQSFGGDYQGSLCSPPTDPACSLSVETIVRTYTDGYRNKLYTMFGAPATGTSMVYGAALRWTTGTATASDYGGMVVSIIMRTGYDNRTADGAGRIQLLSPKVTNWAWTGGTATTSFIATLRLEFAPEPSHWALLAAGAIFMALAYRRRAR